MEYKLQQYKKAKQEENKCLVCKRMDGIVNNLTEGTAVCKYCGSVEEYSVIDESSEWRNFGNDGSGKSNGGISNGDRTGGNVNTDLDSYGLDTMITGGNGDDSKLQRIANRYQSNHDKNIKTAMLNFKHYANIMNLTRQWREYVNQIYAQSERNGRLKGKSYESKIAATIYMASKMCNRPKNLREIITATKCKRRDVTKWYKILSQDLPSQRIKTNMSEWVTTLCNRCDVSGPVEQAARACVEMVWEREMLTGKNPNTIAGACLYMIAANSHKVLDYKIIAEAAGLAESTIRETYKKIYPFRVEVIPQWYIPRIPIIQMKLN